MNGQYEDAINCYSEAIAAIKENSNLYTLLGLIYLRINEESRAFECFGNAMIYDPKNTKVSL